MIAEQLPLLLVPDHLDNEPEPDPEAELQANVASAYSELIRHPDDVRPWGQLILIGGTGFSQRTYELAKARLDRQIAA